MAINENPIEHIAHNFTRFTAKRADLKGGVEVEKPYGIPEILFAQDVAEFAAWHRGCIFDQLNGFQGYDCIQFVIYSVPS